MDVDASVKPHQLCPTCRQFCTTSVILRDIPRNHAARKHELNEGKELTFRPIQVETFDVHNYCSFQKCAAEGSCHLCSIAWAELTREAGSRALDNMKTWRSNDSMLTGVVTTGGANSPASGLLTFKLGKENFKTQIMLLSSFAPETAPLEAQYAAQLVWSTGSRATIALAQKWLRDCLTNHAACSNHRNSAVWVRRLPSRLIKLGSKPHIVDTLDLPHDTAYLTLSHMWGDAQFLVLLTTNIEQLRIAIPDDELSQTHRDALSITRSLGYGYIWIDSLCIVQDSSSDWRSQSALMASIYGNSACTIAAASGTGGGCFVERNPLMQRPCCLTETISMQSPGVYAHRYHSVGWSDYNNHYYLNNPFLKRAWIQQERILSARILYFDSEEVHWECCSLQASEVWPTSQPNHEHGYDYVYPLKAAFEAQLKPYRDWNFDDYHAFGYELWHYGVFEAYLKAQLTYEKDRLVALAGIVGVIQQRTGLTYVAGLWKELMPAELFWSHTQKPESGKSHLTNMPWRAPSWSWASTMGRKRHDPSLLFKQWRMSNWDWANTTGRQGPDSNVASHEIGTKEGTYVSQLLDCTVSPLKDGGEVLGEVTGGTITITGFLATLPRIGLEDHSGPNGYVNFDIDVSDIAELFQLCLLRSWNDGETKGAISGLILARTEDRIQQAQGKDYIRVGVFHNSYPLDSGCIFDGVEEVHVTIH